MKYGLLATFVLVPGFVLFLQEPTSPGAPSGARSQAAAQTAPPVRGQTPPQQRMVAYPDRKRAPQEVLDRGKAVYGVSCAFCHGSDAGGGEVGPNLWRSAVVLEDQSGESIMPIVHGSRMEKGMPRIDITDAQVGDIAAWLHSLHVASRTESSEGLINIVTGNAAAGKVSFDKTCGSCHSVTGDLQGFATKFPVARVMQQTWLLPGGGGGRGPASGSPAGVHVPPTMVTVTGTNGQKVEGQLTRIDDFYVGLKESDGTVRGFAREGEMPKVEIHDPLKPHRELLKTYTDKQIHDITAYLVTIK